MQIKAISGYPLRLISATTVTVVITGPLIMLIDSIDILIIAHDYNR